MSAGETIRVLVADDQRVVREGLATILGLLPGIEVVGVAADGEEAVARAVELAPEIVLMDLRMPRCDGVEATGARGFLTKDAGAEDIRQALQAVASGEAAIDPSVQRQLVDAVAGVDLPLLEPPPPPELPDGLTRREAQVLTLIAEGLSNAEIAAELFVAEATVKSHINHVFTKTGVRDRAQAVTYAYRQGLASA
jgi:DNA-binding NarL/FixJ family response regulator